MEMRADLRWPGVSGALCALLAALTGIGAHGWADRSVAGHVPGIDALSVMTAGVLALGAAAGIGASALGSWAARHRARGPHSALPPAVRRLAFLLGPVTAGQWFSHVMVSADHRAQAMLAAGGQVSGGHAHGANGHAHAAVPPAPLAQLTSTDVAHQVHWLPMLAAHAAGVALCIAVFALVDRVFAWSVRTLSRLVVPAPRPRPSLRPRRARAVPRAVRPHAASGPRAPPVLLAR